MQHQTGIDELLYHCIKDRGDQISYAIAKMVIANALPFSLVESPYFVDMVQALNKAYVKVRRFMALIQRVDDWLTGYTETWLIDNLIGKVRNI